MKKYIKFVIAGLILTGSVSTNGSNAAADSCWNHNGSLMRLKASGNQRWIYYEAPKSSLLKSGVRRGTLLFNGRKSGNYYIGTARRFSKFCPGTPLEYSVEGPVRADQLQVTVFGSREVYKRCQPTGRFADDTLVFTYKHKC